MQLLKRLESSSLVRSSIIYVICDGINRSIPFLLLPFITHYLTPTDYGVVTNFNVYVQILSVFGYLCTAGALPVMFNKLEKQKIRSYVSNMIILNTLMTISGAFISFEGYVWLEQSLNISLLFQFYALTVVWFAGITNVNMLLWRCEEKPLSFGIYQISQSALNALSTILFVIILLQGWQGRIYSMMLSTIVFGLVSIVVLYKRGYIEFSIDKTYLKQTLFFALPIVPHALSFWFKGGVDKILLTNLCGLSENGLYSVAMTWGAIVSMFLVSYNNAYAPYLYKNLAMIDKDKVGTIGLQKKMVRLIWMSIGGTFFLVLLSWFVSAGLIRVMYAPAYYASLEYLPWVMVGQFFYGGYLTFVCFIHYTFNTKMLGLITFSLSLAQIALTYLLIVWVGAVGAAVSSAIISLLTFFFVSRYAMRVYRLPWFSYR